MEGPLTIVMSSKGFIIFDLIKCVNSSRVRENIPEVQSVRIKHLISQLAKGKHRL